MSSGGGLVGLAALAFLGWYFLSGDDGQSSKPQAVASDAAISEARVETEPPRWEDHRICGHGIQTYFFVVMPPRFIVWKGNSLKFRTEAGNETWCTLSGDRIVFEWINRSGEQMFSQSTTFRILPDGRLKVKSDMQEMAFEY